MNMAAAYKPAYLLGKARLKLELLEKLKGHLVSGNVLKLSKLSVQFLQGTISDNENSGAVLPVFIDNLPTSFSQDEYFQNLQTKELGQIALFTEKITSCMDVICSPDLPNGFVVVALEQTEGIGRSGNVWVSPRGCAMFGLQIHIPLESYLGQHVTLLQHLVGLAVVTAVVSIPGYQNLDLKLKWPNDIFAGNSEKVGGVMVTSSVRETCIVCSVGSGINLSNEFPTTCINSLIEEHNRCSSTKLEKFTLEKFLALVFTELETILATAEVDMPSLIQSYYKHWLHNNAVVSITDKCGKSKQVTVLGIDEFGFLLVRDTNGVSFSVQSSENSFDIFQSHIKPKMKL